jgi:hypothetical protein
MIERIVFARAVLVAAVAMCLVWGVSLTFRPVLWSTAYLSTHAP